MNTTPAKRVLRVAILLSYIETVFVGKRRVF